MTVYAFRLRNFMAFQDTGWIKLCPVTLLFGRNSSGKSVITRALRLLKQSVSSEKTPLLFNSEDGVMLDSLKTVFHDDQKEKKTEEGSNEDPRRLTFSFICRIQRTSNNLYKVLNHHFQKVHQEPSPEQNTYLVEFNVSFGQQLNNECPELKSFSFCYPGLEKNFIFEAALNSDDVRDETNEVWTFHTDILHGHETGSRKPVWPYVNVKTKTGFFPTFDPPIILSEFSQKSVSDFRFVSELLDETSEIIIDFLNHINFIGPLRPEPQRTFVFDESTRNHWENQGWRAYLQFLCGEIDNPDAVKINVLLKHLELGENAVVEHARFLDTHISRVDITEASGSKRNIMDLGFGTAQVLPILIQTVLLQKDELTIIDQPELHLHPRAQARLADAFIQSVQGKEGLYLIETHSEFLILRIQRRIQETYKKRLPESSKEVTPEMVGIYVIDRPSESTTSSVFSISIDKDGKFCDPWPNGFFPEGFNERFLIDE